MIQDYKAFMEECVSALEQEHINKNGYSIAVEKGSRACDYDGNYRYVYYAIIIRNASNNLFAAMIKVSKNSYKSNTFDYDYAIEFGGGLGYQTKYINGEKETKDFVLKLIKEYINN